MPILPSGGARFIETGSGAGPRAVPMILKLAVDGIYDFVDTGAGAPDAEMADITGTGIYDVIPYGTSPSAPRVRAYRIAGSSSVIIY